MFFLSGFFGKICRFQGYGFLQSDIDDLRIYNRAINQTEINVLLNEDLLKAKTDIFTSSYSIASTTSIYKDYSETYLSGNENFFTSIKIQKTENPNSAILSNSVGSNMSLTSEKVF